ncbi:MAG: polysaccharide pyruvyl transferase family protein [Clostridia bacterium]|nr:polysaccharide pyruvyl transferase family protein [Clostridia bacterium]
MKISIVTLHRVRNYGSSLQTLATQNFIENNGAEAEIIDYYPERYTSLGLLKRLKNKSETLKNNKILLLAAQAIISISYIRKKLVFDSFLKKYVKLSPKTYRSEDELAADVPDSDAYCTGSDQVWNSHWNEGVDRPLYLSFVPDDKYKFSYAASIGNEKLSNEEAEQVAPLLSSYKHITVRENVGVGVIEALGLNAKQVLDPTLLFTGDDWQKYTSDKYRNKKYIVTYNLHHDKRIDEFATALGKKYGCSVYNISYNIHDIIRKGTLKWCPKIEEYLGLIRDAECVVTDSFHATVFSILFHTKFFVIYPEEASSRLRSILSLTGLESSGYEDIPDVADYERVINFTKADEILNTERKKANLYLTQVLNEIQLLKGV